MPLRSPTTTHEGPGADRLERALRGRLGPLALLLALAVAAVLAWLASQRLPLPEVIADEGTFLAMAQSLAEDGDLWFGSEDLRRAEAAEGGRAYLILQQSDRGVSYSKPIVFPLLAAPFYGLLGPTGPWLLNGLALALALSLGFVYLRRLGRRDGDGEPSGRALLVLVTFAGAATLVPYVFWRMADSLQASFSLAGLVLTLGALRTPGTGSPGSRWDRLLDHRWAPYAGCLLLAATAVMRIPNLALAAVPVMAAVFARRFRRAAALASALAICFGLLTALTWGLTGEPSPYRAQRTTFTSTTGYPGGEAPRVVEERFMYHPATHRDSLDRFADAQEVAYAAGYFFFGRHTGLAFYFPAGFLFLILALRRTDAAGWGALVGFAGAAAFFLLWKPDNYFGGETFLGNRYILAAYPALLLALPRLPRLRWLAAAWLLAALSYGSAVASLALYGDDDRGSQSHAYAGAFRILPYESTAQGLEGRTDRYWSGHFVRFVDPFADASRYQVDLEAGRPPTEVMVAHWQPPGVIRVWVDAEDPGARLEVTEGGPIRRRLTSVAVGADLQPRGPVGVPVDIEPFTPWRRHGFWFESQLFWARFLRLRLDAEAGTRARITYIGDPEVQERTFSYRTVEAPQLDGPVIAGGTSALGFEVQNTGWSLWRAKDVTAVTARYRLWMEGEEKPAVESGRIPLQEPVGPHENARFDFEVEWPDPGVYHLEVDLVLEHVDWFANRVGSPVWRQRVNVAPAVPRAGGAGGDGPATGG